MQERVLDGYGYCHLGRELLAASYWLLGKLVRLRQVQSRPRSRSKGMEPEAFVSRSRAKSRFFAASPKISFGWASCERMGLPAPGYWHSGKLASLAALNGVPLESPGQGIEPKP